MITSYFYENFTSNLKSLHITQKPTKFSGAMVSGALLCSPHGVLFTRANRLQTLSTTSRDQTTTRVLFSGFFLKKAYVIFCLLRDRSTIQLLTALARDTNFQTVRLLCSVIYGLNGSDNLTSFNLMRRPSAALNVIATNSQVFKTSFRFSKKPKRFLFFYFTSFLLAPNQSQQSDNFMNRSWLYLPYYAIFLLFFLGVSVETRGLLVKKILLLN